MAFKKNAYPISQILQPVKCDQKQSVVKSAIKILMDDTFVTFKTLGTII